MAKAVADQGHPVDRFLVQRMVDDGVELLVGVVHDALFGPVVACVGAPVSGRPVAHEVPAWGG